MLSNPPAKPKTRASSSACWALLATLLSSCASPGGPKPVFRGKIYRGDSARAGVTRAQGAETIPATDPKFDLLVCFTEEDYLNELIKKFAMGCREWKP